MGHWGIAVISSRYKTYNYNAWSNSYPDYRYPVQYGNNICTHEHIPLANFRLDLLTSVLIMFSVVIYLSISTFLRPSIILTFIIYPLLHRLYKTIAFTSPVIIIKS